MWCFQAYFTDTDSWYTRGAYPVSLEDAIALSQKDYDCVRRPERFRVYNLDTAEAIPCALLR